MLALGYQNYQSVNALASYSSKYCHILIILSVFFNMQTLPASKQAFRGTTKHVSVIGSNVVKQLALLNSPCAEDEVCAGCAP